MMLRARREYAHSEIALEVDNAVYALDASTIDLTLSLFPGKLEPQKGQLNCMR